ncbi:MAG: polysaccharide biosynthesis/export family protein [Rhodobacteraceae bacterium]|nr:polysaccharide biosynthesis/export family protein [Paracoccaceae bacterium]
MKRLVFAFFAAVLVAGCTDGTISFPVTEDSQRGIEEDVEIIRLTESNIEQFTMPARAFQPTRLQANRMWDYRVGTGDILSVIVFDHPELTLPAGPQRTAAESGFRVQRDGTFFYPFVGQVMASGRTPEEVRAELTERLSEYIPNPQLEVRVAEFNAQIVVVSGEVKSPNRQRLTTAPLSLAEAVNAAGGLTERADSRNVTLQRGGVVYSVDLQGFLSAGIRQNNPILRDGDVINVPRREATEAYLLGEIRRPDVIDLSQDRITLTQAITRRGGINELRADARGIFVFRAGHPRIRVFQLDVSSPTGILLGTRFVLEPGDVIYITRSPLQRWNDTITRILPTVRAVNPAVGALERLEGLAN